MIGLSIDAESGGETLFDTKVSDMQSNVVFRNDIREVYGNLNYFEDGLADSGPLAGAGHFLAFQMTADDWTDYSSVKVGLVPSASDMGLVEISTDPDKNGVFKITSTSQVFRIQYTIDGDTKIVDYGLTGLNLE